MAAQTVLIMGVMLVAVAAQTLDESDSCAEELAQLRERERFLQNKEKRQGVFIRRLQQVSQHPAHRESQNQTLPPRDQAPSDTPHRDCADVYRSGSNTSGVYSIRPRGSPAPTRASCDMRDGGGWTVLQRRLGGALLFNRSWAEYKDGFGDINQEGGEFWLGNKHLHYLTDQGNYSLRIVLEDFGGSQRYAEYNNFRVGPEKSDFQLSFGDFSGTAGDALSGNFQAGVSTWASHQGMRFSTYDRDNDKYRGNCAQEDKGGWWFNRCHSAHLNGRYYHRGYYSAVTDDGLVWFTWRGWWYSLKSTVMKIRPAHFTVEPLDGLNVLNPAPQTPVLQA